ncbi:hypothetical protein ACG04Q_08070 [Roseateles sp. DXS20W]|uniref:Uncharacterized protein n=1 Tax=Pelomonas lactea TaxID=3299030 RepID=A0ABW7GHT9_9BURK
MSRQPFGFDAAAHERHHWWRSVLFKLALGGVIAGLLWRWVGGMAGLLLGMLVVLRALGQALAPDLVALGATTWRALRGLAFSPVEGRFYQFKGHRVRIEDDELLRQRWLALDDLATALGSPMPAVSLRRRWPEGVRQQRDGVYVLDDVALAWLAEQRDERAGRLRHWVEREVWYPARGRRAGYTQNGAPAGAPPKD